MTEIALIGKTTDYTFKYTDCDVNRHVNTVKYLDLLLNQFNLEKYDQNFVKRNWQEPLIFTWWERLKERFGNNDSSEGKDFDNYHYHKRV